MYIAEQNISNAFLGPGCSSIYRMQKPKTSVGWILVGRRNETRQFALATAPVGSSQLLLAISECFSIQHPGLQTLAVAQKVELVARGRASFFLQHSLRLTYYLQAGGSLQFPPQVKPLRRELAGKIGPRAVYRLAVNISSVLQEFHWCCNFPVGGRRRVIWARVTPKSTSGLHSTTPFHSGYSAGEACFSLSNINITNRLRFQCGLQHGPGIAGVVRVTDVRSPAGIVGLRSPRFRGRRRVREDVPGTPDGDTSAEQVPS